jgi:hypothetical protein
MCFSNDKVNFTGNALLLDDNIKVCPIGSIESAKIDEMYFDNSGCSIKGNPEFMQTKVWNL